MPLPEIAFQYDSLLGLKEDNKDIRKEVITKLNDLFNKTDDVKDSVSLAHTLIETLDSSETSFERIIKLQQQENEINDNMEFNKSALMILKSSSNVIDEDIDDIEDKLNDHVNEVIKDNPIRKEELKIDPNDV